MTKVTQKAVESFLSGQNFNSSNTKVTSNGHTVEMFLFDNLIAQLVGGTLKITNAGWESKTTKDRLNGLPNVSIQQIKKVWYLNGEKWDGEMTEIK